ncbi:hypothetical protein ACH5RR_003405 [Cinchona calisaya]|uniref:DUF4283 domain-containing protein n=1 Tax=Cinchona calisaya TaxID=153742 RepID=A0ABD3AUQ5_9GENT
MVAANMVLFKFFDRVDLPRVLEGSSWSLDKNMLLIKEYRGNIQPSKMNFDTCDFWVMVLKLLLNWMDWPSRMMIGNKLGQAISVDVRKDGLGWGEFVRIRVEGRESISVRREQLAGNTILLKIEVTLGPFSVIRPFEVSASIDVGSIVKPRKDKQSLGPSKGLSMDLNGGILLGQGSPTKEAETKEGGDLAAKGHWDKGYYFSNKLQMSWVLKRANILFKTEVCMEKNIKQETKALSSCNESARGGTGWW